ncbi:MAG TPA: hypothetical protein VK968_01780, partial [Roseimicrobium sp.]|nr:hypothetical protein [Roseimicrobium sp.]
MGTKTKSLYASAVAESSKITQLAEILRAKWKYEIKKLPVYRRWAWLNGDEGLRAFDAKTRSSMMKQLERRMGEMASVVCAWSWNRDFAYYGMMPPELRYVA